jgi:hypothetical protein
VTQHPPVHHPKNPVLGFHGWDEPVPQGLVYLVSSSFFSSCLFFSPIGLFVFGSSLFFFPGSFWFFFSFSLHPNHHWGGGGWTPTYPSNLPTTFPPTSPSTSLILLTPLLCLCCPPSPTVEIMGTRV